MGQGCSGSFGDDSSAIVTPSQNTALQQSTAATGASKKVNNWRLLYSSRIDEIVGILTHDDVRVLLVRSMLATI